MSIDFHRLEKVLAEAAARADPADRAAYLQEACGDDHALRAEVDRLLAANQEVGDFLETPVHAAADEFGNDAPVVDSIAGIEGLGSIIGRYKLLEQIGEGGFGVVYMAEQTEPVQRKVALKVVKAGMDTREVAARFEAERQALALMDHPSIARVFDGGVTQGGRPYFVMELVRGIAITEFCDQRNLSTVERLKLFIQVCHAVQHAHQKGIIHRDLKPSNILVTLVDGEPVAKVIDFGVAKALGQKLTERTLFTGFLKMVGTPAYMSPEQADLSGVDIDTRADIYALGVLLYELLTGVTPFDGDTLRNAALYEIRRMIRETEPPKPSTRLQTLVAADVRRLNSKSEAEGDSLRRLLQQRKELIALVRGDLDWIVMKCLEKERGRRYETASALAQDVHRHLANEPITARPPSKIYRLQKLVQRNKLTFAAGTTAVVSMVIGLTLATTMFFKERTARRQADEQAAIAQAVNEFLQNDLLRQADSRAQADARFTPDPNLTMHEALERASHRIGDRFSEQPLTESAIRLAIGDSLRGVGQPGQAVHHLRRALELSQTHLGPEHFNTLECMHRLAVAYTDAGQFDLALPLLEKLLKLRQARLGREHPDTLSAMNELAWAYQGAGKLAQALPLAEETFRLRKDRLGYDHPQTLDSMANLAVTCQFSGYPDRALPLLEEVLKLRTKRLGPDHPDTLNSIHNLTGALYDAGKLEQVLPLGEEALRKRVAKQGPEHPDTLIAKHNLAMIYLGLGMLGQALPLLENTLRSWTTTLGADHPNTLLTMNGLADAYRDVDRSQDALLLFDEALQLARAKLGDNHRVTIRLLGNRARAHQDAGRLEEAIRLHEETTSVTKAWFGPDHPETLRSLSNLAWARALVGDLERSLPLLEVTLDSEMTKLGPGHHLTLATMNNLASAYQQAGSLDRALPLFEETLDSCKTNLGPSHRNTLRCMNDLALAYQAAGQLEQSLRLLQEALKLETARFGPEHPETLNTQERLSRCLLRQGNHTNAEAVARDCFNLRERLTPKHWRTFEIQITLGRALLVQQKLPEAETLLVQGYRGLEERERSIPAGSRGQIKVAASALAELFEALGKPAEAARWRRASE